ncbi:MAG TPA: hypothetical protein VLG49_04910 [Rhabdochlamydiaceae bacterium]|nr:hypothetical protein [Rhabdochlamydiaceae bacterium]
MANIAVSYPYRPFSDVNTFLDGMQFLELADISRSSRVCKIWNKAIKGNQHFWIKLSEREGIPIVNGVGRDRKEDFKTLYQITAVSGRAISELFGKMVGKVPPINEALFNRLNDPDPFEEGKLIKENYVFVVDPSFIERKEATLNLDESGNLIELFKKESESNETQDLVIPFSLKNLRILSKYPLKGNENTPVFKNDSPGIVVFNQCDTCSDKVSIYFMRKHLAENSRGMSYSDQKELVEKNKFEVTPLRKRTLFDFVMIFQSGTCPDAFITGCIFVRTSDSFCFHNPIYLPNPVYLAHIGNFIKKTGIRVDYSFENGERDIGVVPGIPADA